MSKRLAIACLWTAALAACATARPAPRFVESAAYRAAAHSTYGVLQRDVPATASAPARTQAVVARRANDAGYSLRVLDYDPHAETAAQWTERCASAAVAGDALLHLAWVGSPEAPLLLLTAGEENPEEVVQNVRLIDPSDCSSRFSERLLLPHGEGGEPTLPGVVPSPDGRQLRIYDRMDMLRLVGAGGPTSLPVRCRERCAEVSATSEGPPQWQSRSLGLLVTTAAQMSWRAADIADHPLPELFDGRDDTAFALRPQDAGHLLIHAAAPLVLLELHHGCEAHQPAAVLRVGAGDERNVYEINTSLPVRSFVRAAGRRRAGGAFTQDLLALTTPASDIDLHLPSSDALRCVREIVTYTFLPFEGLTQRPCR